MLGEWNVTQLGSSSQVPSMDVVANVSSPYELRCRWLDDEVVPLSFGKAATSSTLSKPVADVQNDVCTEGALSAPCVSHVMVCARLLVSTLSKKILDASRGASQELFACGTLIASLPCSAIFALSGPAPANAFLPRHFSMTYCSILPFAVTDFASLFLVCWTPFFTAFNLQKKKKPRHWSQFQRTRVWQS